FILYSIYFLYHDGDLKVKDTDDLRNYTLILAAVLAIPFAIWRGLVASKTANIAEKTQVTTSFTTAITQLGDKELSIRLGGIYALRKIAEDHPKSYKDVVGNTLQAFIRSTSKYELTEKDIYECEEDEEKLKEKESNLKNKQIKEDISAALASLLGIGIKKLSLPYCLLNRAQLQEAQLQGAQLQGAQLINAFLGGAQLKHAFLDRACLEKAILIETNLQGAILQEANLKGAKLGESNLQRADLKGANLKEVSLSITNLEGANLKGAD
ncbi:MAG: pentapeptide repeat-containing protein, partial [Deltaproteobacteria bacterium]|nr:pentapeptide repeat-containing protein [Deltaproteobacteria bacterium]